MKRYSKDDVETHSDHCYGPYYPAVNVKHYGLNFDLVGRIVDKFGCSEAVAERAAGWQWDMACQVFWEDVGGTAEYILGPGLKVYSAGRSGGWAIVIGLPPIESWDAVQLAKWRKFENALRREVEYRTSWQAVYEDIEANRWAEENAEEYNYCDTKQGTICLADVPRCEHCR